MQAAWHIDGIPERIFGKVDFEKKSRQQKSVQNYSVSVISVWITMIYIFFFVVLFDMFDVDKQKVLTHDGMFRIYKLMFTNAISDDHILALVFSALKHPDLAKPGEITKNEFIQVFLWLQIVSQFWDQLWLFMHWHSASSSGDVKTSGLNIIQGT